MQKLSRHALSSQGLQGLVSYLSKTAGPAPRRQPDPKDEGTFVGRKVKIYYHKMENHKPTNEWDPKEDTIKAFKDGTYFTKGGVNVELHSDGNYYATNTATAQTSTGSPYVEILDQ